MSPLRGWFLEPSSGIVRIPFGAVGGDWQTRGLSTASVFASLSPTPLKMTGGRGNDSARDDGVEIEFRIGFYEQL